MNTYVEIFENFKLKIEVFIKENIMICEEHVISSCLLFAQTNFSEDQKNKIGRAIDNFNKTQQISLEDISSDINIIFKLEEYIKSEILGE